MITGFTSIVIIAFANHAGASELECEQRWRDTMLRKMLLNWAGKDESHVRLRSRTYTSELSPSYTV